ncbi:MAG: hypothetical protein AB8G11_11070 [Saprospiraceae bacterium]
MKIIKWIVVFCFLNTTVFAQIKLDTPKYLTYDVPQKYETILFIAIDSILMDIETGNFDDMILSKKSAKLFKATYDWALTYYIQLDLKNDINLSKQITNICLLEKDVYSISVAYFQHKNDTTRLRYNLQLIADFRNNQLVFDLPLHYETALWHRKTIGTTTYIFRGKLNKERVNIFNQKNIEMAQKFGLEVVPFDFYMCRNYQEVLRLLGIEYSVYANGNVNEGYGVVDNTIFAIQNNEDFSHDIFHFYSAKLYQRKDRNWIAEEGIAYLWGNAYYTDENGEMITVDTLVALLKDYLQQDYSKSIYELFETDDGIYPQFDARVSIRSVISAVLVHEVEQKYGQKGVQQLINCGDDKRMANYLEIIDELLNINKVNFDEELLKLIYEF